MKIQTMLKNISQNISRNISKDMNFCKIIVVIVLFFLLLYLGYFYYQNLTILEPFCNDCRISPDLGSTKNIGNFLDSRDNKSLSQSILSTRCTNVPVGTDSSYIFCPFTNNCSLPVYPGKSYSNNSNFENQKCIVDNSCCNTDFYNNNYYLDNNGIKHPGLVFEVGSDQSVSVASGTPLFGGNSTANNNNYIEVSYNIMSYMPVIKDSGGYFPKLLGRNYHTTITNNTDLNITSNSNKYIDCEGNLMSSTNRNLPIFYTNSNILTTPEELWCLQAENQQLCKKNSNSILVPNAGYNL